jgi:hypothetical protein
VSDDNNRDRDARLLRHALPILEELLSPQNSIMANIEYHAKLVKSAPQVRQDEASRLASLIRDFESAMLGEMIRAMPDAPPQKIAPAPAAQPKKHYRPHPWRNRFKLKHNP